LGIYEVLEQTCHMMLSRAKGQVVVIELTSEWIDKLRKEIKETFGIIYDYKEVHKLYFPGVTCKIVESDHNSQEFENQLKKNII